MLPMDVHVFDSYEIVICVETIVSDSRALYRSDNKYR